MTNSAEGEWRASGGAVWNSTTADPQFECLNNIAAIELAVYLNERVRSRHSDSQAAARVPALERKLHNLKTLANQSNSMMGKSAAEILNEVRAALFATEPATQPASPPSHHMYGNPNADPFRGRPE